MFGSVMVNSGVPTGTTSPSFTRIWPSRPPPVVMMMSVGRKNTLVLRVRMLIGTDVAPAGITTLPVTGWTSLPCCAVPVTVYCTEVSLIGAWSATTVKTTPPPRLTPAGPP